MNELYSKMEYIARRFSFLVYLGPAGNCHLTVLVRETGVDDYIGKPLWKSDALAAFQAIRRLGNDCPLLDVSNILFMSLLFKVGKTEVYGPQDLRLNGIIFGLFCQEALEIVVNKRHADKAAQQHDNQQRQHAVLAVQYRADGVDHAHDPIYRLAHDLTS